MLGVPSAAPELKRSKQDHMHAFRRPGVMQTITSYGYSQQLQEKLSRRIRTRSRPVSQRAASPASRVSCRREKEVRDQSELWRAYDASSTKRGNWSRNRETYHRQRIEICVLIHERGLGLRLGMPLTPSPKSLDPLRILPAFLL